LELAQKFQLRLLNRGFTKEFLFPFFRNLISRDSLLSSLSTKKKPSNKNELNEKSSRGPIITVDMLPKFQQPLSLKSLFEIPVEITSHPRYIKCFGKNNIIIGKKLGNSIGKLFSPGDHSAT
jgi:hypothetical protein